MERYVSVMSVPLRLHDNFTREIFCLHFYDFLFKNYVFLLGYERVVVLNDIETIREALSKSTDFAGKSAFSYFVDQFSMGFRGIISPNYSKKLMFMRKLAIKSMHLFGDCLLYTSPSPRDGLLSRMPSSA